MKSKLIKLTVIIITVLQLICCKDRFSMVYTLVLPKIPDNWVLILGEPHWKVEFLDNDGRKREKYLLPGQNTEIELPVTWTNPVTAWPYWPDSELIPYFFKPAGALFPFDVSGNLLCLSWEAGSDSVFYWELAFANDQDVTKAPANFDWLRFRELFKTDVLSSAVIKDPWLIDWRFVAEKTIDSNFDRRRLVPQTTEPLNVPVSAGPWFGTSPYSEPLFFDEKVMPVFPVHSGINVWVSSQGILRINGKTWVLKAGN
jgi:hypothetical protein